MRIIVAGGGDVGEQVAAELVAPGNGVTVVEVDPSRAEELMEASEATVVCGDACLSGVLESAGGLNTDVLVACTGQDEENLLIATLAKRLLEIPRVVARVNDVTNRWLFEESADVDAAISSVAALIALIEEATGSAGTVRLADLEAIGLILVETTVDRRSPARGVLIGDLRLGKGDMVAAVVRRGRPVRAEPSLALAAGDRVLILTRTDGEARIHAAFNAL